jgi:VanZ family protein
MKSFVGLWLKTGGQVFSSAWRAPILWGMAFLWMAGIFYFSSLSDPLFFLGTAGRRPPVGKYFHVGEYAGLGLILFFALRATWHPPEVRSGRTSRSLTAVIDQASPWALSFLGAVAYACLDEWHQGFVPGRNSTLADVRYDALGIAGALALICVFRSLRLRLKPLEIDS